MAVFDHLKTSLKEKWLQFFQNNRFWLVQEMEVQSVKTPDGGRRPPSYLILGAISALEPQLAEILLPFCKLNPDVDALIEVLELNFDPEVWLENNRDMFDDVSEEMVSDELGQILFNEMTDALMLEPDDDDGIDLSDLLLNGIADETWDDEDDFAATQSGKSSLEEQTKPPSQPGSDIISRLFPNS